MSYVLFPWPLALNSYWNGYVKFSFIKCVVEPPLSGLLAALRILTVIVRNIQYSKSSYSRTSWYLVSTANDESEECRCRIKLFGARRMPGMADLFIWEQEAFSRRYKYSLRSYFVGVRREDIALSTAKGNGRRNRCPWCSKPQGFIRSYAILMHESSSWFQVVVSSPLILRSFVVKKTFAVNFQNSSVRNQKWIPMQYIRASEFSSPRFAFSLSASILLHVAGLGLLLWSFFVWRGPLASAAVIFYTRLLCWLDGCKAVGKQTAADLDQTKLSIRPRMCKLGRCAGIVHRAAINMSSTSAS